MFFYIFYIYLLYLFFYTSFNVAYLSYLPPGVRHNFFMPPMKLIHKERQRGKVKKSHEIDIPINRIVKLDCVSEDKKQRLLNLRNSIDIVWLTEEIERFTEALCIAYEKKLRRLNHEKI